MSLIYYSYWKYLPEIIILEIYKYLDDEEKVNMALTCKRWGALFDSACLWRVRHFYMGGFNLDEVKMQAKTFMERHGAHVRHLNISCGHRPYDTNALFLRCVEDLMSSQLRDNRLSEFGMRNLQLGPSRDKFINCFVRFLKHQHHLKIFDMTSAQFSLSDGIRILDTIGTQCGNIMDKLIMEDFFPSGISMFQIEKFKRVLAHFSNLNYLAINYNCLSDSVLDIFATNLVGLRTMKIKVRKDDPHIHRISGHAWKQMVTCCPGLSVSFWFDSVCHWSEIVPILKREIPVTDIHLWTGYLDDANGWGLTRTINHIAECYRNSLESISLRLDNNHENVDDGILRLIRTCKKLRDVRIDALISRGTIKSILQQHERNEIHLQSLTINACRLIDGGWVETLIRIKENDANLGTDH